MSPAPRRIDNLEIEKLELMNFVSIEVIYLNTKGGAG